MTQTRTAIAAAAILSLAAFAMPAQAGHGFATQLAERLMRQSIGLQHVVHDTLHGNRHEEHLLNDADSIRREAERAWRAAARGDARELHKRLERVERELEHFHRVLVRARFDDGHFDHGHPGQLFGHGGHRHSSIYPVLRLLGEMNDTIRRMHHAEEHLHYAPPAPVFHSGRHGHASAPAVRVGQGGVQINGRGFSLSFGR